MAIIEHIDFDISLCISNSFDICHICKNLYSGKCSECENTTKECIGIKGECGHYLHHCCIINATNASRTISLKCPSCRKPWKCIRVDPNIPGISLLNDLTCQFTVSFTKDYEVLVDENNDLLDDLHKVVKDTEEELEFVFELNDDVENSINESGEGDDEEGDEEEEEEEGEEGEEVEYEEVEYEEVEYEEVEYENKKIPIEDEIEEGVEYEYEEVDVEEVENKKIPIEDEIEEEVEYEYEEVVINDENN